MTVSKLELQLIHNSRTSGSGWMIAWSARMALENIANSDALYHNTEHTMLVTIVGQEILSGKHMSEGGVTPDDWLHVNRGPGETASHSATGPHGPATPLV